MKRTVLIIWIVIVSLIFPFFMSACKETSGNASDIPEISDKINESNESNTNIEENYAVPADLKLEKIIIKDGKVTFTTSSAEYGNKLFPLATVELLLARADNIHIAKGLVTIAGGDNIVEFKPGTRTIWLNGVQGSKENPSFVVGEDIWLSKELLLDLIPGGKISGEGITFPLIEGAAIDGKRGTNNNSDSQISEGKLLSSKGLQEPFGRQSLINKEHMLTADFVRDMVSLNGRSSYFRCLKNSMLLDTAAADHLEDMLKDAAVQGIEPIYLVSSYRNYSYQRDIYERKIRQYMNTYGYDRKTATVEAGKIVTIPGASEHQSGLAVDMTSKTLVDKNLYLEPEFLYTEAGKWLKKNSWQYGFILRYQESKENITQIVPEAWHYRYVGLPHSQIITEKGFALEEYMEYLKNERHIDFVDYLGDGYRVIYIDKQKIDAEIEWEEGFSELSSTNEGGYILTIKK